MRTFKKRQTELNQKPSRILSYRVQMHQEGLEFPFFDTRTESKSYFPGCMIALFCLEELITHFTSLA